MTDEKNADRSSIEIKTLLRKLHPDRGNHRDRVRALTKFRNYVMGGGKKPEFYDDDIPLLLLGSQAPSQYIDPDDETLVGLYGLLQACGTLASDDSHGLKRSARQAMDLTKQLLFDWKDESGAKAAGTDGPKNVIATSFLSLPVKYYAHMQLHVHCRGEDTRAAAKEEACQILVLILEHHLTEDGEKPAPVMVDDVLHNPKAQQEFECTCVCGVCVCVLCETEPRECEQDALGKNELLEEKTQNVLTLLLLLATVVSVL